MCTPKREQERRKRKKTKRARRGWQTKKKEGLKGERSTYWAMEALSDVVVENVRRGTLNIPPLGIEPKTIRLLPFS